VVVLRKERAIDQIWWEASITDVVPPTHPLLAARRERV
jgi:hypothetical protein